MPEINFPYWEALHKSCIPSQRWRLFNYNNTSIFEDEGNNSYSGNESGDIGN